MKPRKIALAILPGPAGTLRTLRVVVTDRCGTFGAVVQELTPRGMVQHVIPWRRLVATGAWQNTLRALRAKIALARACITSAPQSVNDRRNLSVAGRAA